MQRGAEGGEVGFCFFDLGCGLEGLGGCYLGGGFLVNVVLCFW